MENNNPKNNLREIKWEEIIFLAEDLGRDPKIIEISLSLFPNDDVGKRKKLTEGLILRIWLNHGGKIPKKYDYRPKNN